MVSRSIAICNAWRTRTSLSGPPAQMFMGDDTSDRNAIGKNCMSGLVFWSSSTLLIDVICATPFHPLKST